MKFTDRIINIFVSLDAELELLTKQRDEARKLLIDLDHINLTADSPVTFMTSFNDAHDAVVRWSKE
jgi:hypothetical protein